MVMCTFLSAPVMFISAQMSLLNYNTQTAIDFERVIKDAMVDVSGTSFPFGVSISIAAVQCARNHFFVYLNEYGIRAVF